jgi:hypothetical protein
MTAAVFVSFAITQGTAALFASDGALDRAPSAAESVAPAAISITDDLDRVAPSRLTLPSTILNVDRSGYGLSGQVYRGRPIQTRNNDGSIAAIIVGSVAAITGTALLFYANRPECGVAPTAGGCGYGAKVIGGSVLTGGVASLLVGALTWR